jgi:hypothetical protein
MTIRLHVERLALEGLTLTGAERAQLERAVVGELMRLIDSHDGAMHVRGAFAEGGSVASLRAAEVRMQPGQSTAALGVQVARSVYGAMAPIPPRAGAPHLTQAVAPTEPRR